MSTCWYFFSFPVSQFNKVFGSATKQQEQKLLEFVEDPDEGLGEEDCLDTAVELAREILHDGISYEGKTDEEKSILDQVVKMALHDMGLGDAIKLKPMSPEPVTLALADELTPHGSKTSLISLFRQGRRFGTDEPPEQSYFILMPEDVPKLKAEVESLIADRAIKWRFPDVPEVAQKNIIAVLEKVAARKEDGLYANLT